MLPATLLAARKALAVQLAAAGVPDVLYDRPAGAPARGWAIVRDLEAVVDVDVIAAGRGGAWRGVCTVDVEFGSGPHQGSPGEADDVVYGMLEGVWRRSAADPTLGVRGVQWCVPSAVRTLASWHEAETRETVVVVTFDLHIRAAS